MDQVDRVDLGYLVDHRDRGNRLDRGDLFCQADHLSITSRLSRSTGHANVTGFAFVT